MGWGRQPGSIYLHAPELHHCGVFSESSFAIPDASKSWITIRLRYSDHLAIAESTLVNTPFDRDIGTHTGRGDCTC